MNQQNRTRRERIRLFLDEPVKAGSIAVQVSNGLLILIGFSIAITVLELTESPIATHHASIFLVCEVVITAIFTVELAIRVYAAEKGLYTSEGRLNWRSHLKLFLDLLATSPLYIELLSLHMGGDAVRLLRVTRMMRLTHLLKYAKFFHKLIGFQGQILQAVTPFIFFFASLKWVVWQLEENGDWLEQLELEQLFALTGFALGIILSQKLGVTYQKFVQVEEAAARLNSTLRSLALIVDRCRKDDLDTGVAACRRWAKDFIQLFSDFDADNLEIAASNAELYTIVRHVEENPAELAVLYSKICEDAAFCLSKKKRLTPVPYDTLLFQATGLYLLAMTIFLPGTVGMVSVAMASYLLFGMYMLTRDFDTIVPSNDAHDLISVEIPELESFAGIKVVAARHSI